MQKTISIGTLMRKAGLEEIGATDSRDGHFLAYQHPERGVTINVEILALNLLETVLLLPASDQRTLFITLSDEVSDVGDQLIVTDDDGGKKARGARVIRLADGVDVINLLVTR